MPREANRTPHSASTIHDQLVWMPRDRKKVLVGPVEARLKASLAEIATQNGLEIMAVEVMPDHGHLFVSAPAKVSPAEIVRLFKGIPWRRLRKAYESIRQPYWGGHAALWAEAYDVGTAGHVSAEPIQRSIEESQQKPYQGWMP